MRNTSSHLKIQFSCAHHSNPLNDLLQTHGIRISKESCYTQCNHMMLYHDIKYLAQWNQDVIILITASVFCAFNCLHKMWTKANVKVQMQSVDISQSYFEPHMYERCKTLYEQKDQCISVTDLVYIITTGSSGITLNQFIGTPMYLLFQGIVKYVIDFSFALLA